MLKTIAKKIISLYLNATNVKNAVKLNKLSQNRCKPTIIELSLPAMESEAKADRPG